MDLHSHPASPASRQNLERFCRLAVEDERLHRALRETPDTEGFVALAIQLGETHGCSFTADDVRSALQEKRRQWLEQWI